jgi:hypothetical protein
MKRAMRTIPAAVIVTLLGLATARAQAPVQSQCVTCHLEQDDSLAQPALKFKDDVHAHAGLGCADCHGGDPKSDDPDVAMSKAKGFVGRPTPLEMPHFCDRCHGNATYMKQYNPGLPVDQLTKYRTSVHGEKNAKGDLKVAQCASCHSPHEMKPSNDPTASIYPVNLPYTCGKCHADSAYMAPYGIPTNQLAQFASSVHGKALLEKHDIGAPACNDCHGNHGASPPLEAAIPNVCGNCHAFNAELFSKSPHRTAFEEQDIPACETCHGAHAITLLTTANLGDGPESVCMKCHEPGDGTRGIATAVAMKCELDSLESGYRRADSLLDEADRKGMYVEDSKFALNDVRQSIIQAHTLVHSFSDSTVRIKADSGMTILASVTGAAESKVAESAFRRWGLLVSTLIISFVAVMLYFKIRQIEKR